MRIGDAGSPHNLGPEFFDFAQRLAGLVSGKEEWGVGIAYLDDGRDERQRLGTERQMLGSLLLGLMRRFRPDAALEIEICLMRAENLTKPGAGQQLKTDSICRPRARMLVKRRA